jgi:hypothetical protein
MKIRSGFVSNSSTSSFCIFGVAVDHQALIDVLFQGKTKAAPKPRPGCGHPFDRETYNFCPHCGCRTWLLTESPTWNQGDIDNALIDYGLIAYEGEDEYVGVRVSGKTLDELGELNEKAQQLREMFGKEPTIIQGSYYN